MKYEGHIFKGMDDAYKSIDKKDIVPIGADHKYVIFSDHHKGAKNGADNFRQCEATYLAALDHYLDKGYSLVILGDAEELQQESPQKILDTYKTVMEKEAAFHKKGKYHKMFGNHDYKWRKKKQVKKHLDPLFPGIRVTEGMLLKYIHPVTDEKGTIMLTHGHQGTFDADRILWLARIGVWFYKYWQILTGKGKTRPSNNYQLRAQHDRVMYTWASKKRNFVLVTGHTHRPVWCSVTHVQKLAEQLRNKRKELIAAKQAQDFFGRSFLSKAELAKVMKIDELKNELAEKIEKYHHSEDTVKTFPTYFNGGCCKFLDGDITGLEFDGEDIRLIKWDQEKGDTGNFKRIVLEEDLLVNIFNDFDPKILLEKKSFSKGPIVETVENEET